MSRKSKILSCSGSALSVIAIYASVSAFLPSNEWPEGRVRAELDGPLQGYEQLEPCDDITECETPSLFIAPATHEIG